TGGRSDTDADFVASDAAVQAALRTLGGAMRLRVPVLIQGETGTGKELMARHAHRLSGRRGQFIAVNCGALPAELAEAELFGHVAGAYTGARRDGSAGLIASADGGTLLLDELGELPLGLQATLLRFLDDQRVRPVGGTATRQVDVQLLAATHVDLEAAVRERQFRADLLYRLNTVRIDLPPLRQRSDFSAIALRLLEQLDPNAQISDDALAALGRARWSGNMRELRSVLTRALLACRDDWIDLALVAPLLPAAPAAVVTGERGERGERGDWVGAGGMDGAAGVAAIRVARTASSGSIAAAGPAGLAWPQVAEPAGPVSPSGLPHPADVGSASRLQQGALAQVLDEFERTGGSVSQTSRNLGISRTTVYRYLREGGRHST
ncbi:MAG: sigma 54-interacting transcriptional regulator, partial [Leptothrix sp. (in: b-proteobacteria)]